jgi:hypothetical protein
MQLLVMLFTIKIFRRAGGNTIYNKYISRRFYATCTKPMWNILILNCITKSCVWNTCVTLQGIAYKLPEDDTIVSKHVGVW